MSVRNLMSHLLLTTFLVSSIPALFAPIAMAGSVSRIHDEAQKGQVVSLEGRVASIKRKRFFTIEDASGSKIMTVIPDHLQRTEGTPKVGEKVRVRGKYDHKTFLDPKQSEKSARDKTWGIRVHSIDRNLTATGRNPTPDPVMSDVQSKSMDSPAAPMSAVTVATPDLSRDLKFRLSTARKEAITARDELSQARAEVARGIYRKAEDAEQAEFAAREKRAQQAYDQAIEAIGPLVEEARSSGMDEKLIELYETDLTRPAR